MALELKLSVYSINADCETFILNDDTVYGAPELERNQVAVYVTGFKKNNDTDDTPLTVSPLNVDPFLVTQWQVTSDKDGWHTFPMYAVPIWDSGTSYVLDDAVYYNGYVYRALRASTNATPDVSPSDWQAVTDMSEIDAAGNIDFSIIDITIGCRSEICYANVVGQAAIDVCNNKCDTLYSKLFKEVDVLMQGANTNCMQEKYAEYENCIRALENVCEDYGPCANC